MNFSSPLYSLPHPFLLSSSEHSPSIPPPFFPPSIRHLPPHSTFRYPLSFIRLRRFVPEPRLALWTFVILVAVCRVVECMCRRLCCLFSSSSSSLACAYWGKATQEDQSSLSCACVQLIIIVGIVELQVVQSAFPCVNGATMLLVVLRIYLVPAFTYRYWSGYRL